MDVVELGCTWVVVVLSCCLVVDVVGLVSGCCWVGKRMLLWMLLGCVFVGLL